MARASEGIAAPQAFDVGRILAGGQSWWAERSPGTKKRIIYGAALALALATVVGLVTSQNPYTVVYANLSESDAGAITQALQANKIPYELQGTTILVPRSEADQVRVNLAEQGLPNQGTVGYANVLKNMSLGETSQEFDLSVLDALQSDLATTIDSIQGVKSSTVQIVEGQPSVFVNQAATGSQASVFVDLEPGVTLTGRQVQGIEDLVAHSVQGLKPSDVSVTDQNGDALTASSAGTDPSTVSGQTAITQSFESTLDRQIESLLTPIVGADNAVVQTSANLDFAKTKTSSVTYTPAKGGAGVAVSNNTIHETFSGTGSPPSVSAPSGSVPTYQGTTTGQNKLDYQDQTINYAVSKVNQTVTSEPYTVNGLTVSVMLNSRVYHLTPANKTALTDLISTAIGQTKGAAAAGAITILAEPFQKVKVPPFPSSSGLPLPEIGGAGAAGLLLLFVAFRFLRRKKPRAQWTPLEPPAPKAAPPVGIPEPQRISADPLRSYLEQATRETEDHPQEMAQVVRMWLKEDSRDKARPRG